MTRLAAFLLALLLAAAPAAAAQDDPRLDELFAQLKATSSATKARDLQSAIWQIWMVAGSGEANLLLREGIAAMSRQDYDTASEAFSRVIELEPGFAEGWNKRATVRFLMFDFAGSVLDIERTMILEPRHFGALSGLGQIYMALDRPEAALKAFEAALAINPHLDSVRAAIEALKKELSGDPT
jgi:tetratricopeptide (TPR) repeat protein